VSLWQHTLDELFLRGGPLMWPLLLCSIVALALMLDRGVAHLRAGLDYGSFIARLRDLTTGGRLPDAVRMCSGLRGPIARTAEAYLRHVELEDELRGSIVEREGSQALEAVEHRQRGLSAVAHIATLTGLLGTVVGLVGAFHQIELAGGHVQPSDLAAGIWQALLTTVFGLTVAIPSFVAFHLFESRADRMARRMGFVVSYLDQWLGKRTAHRRDEAAPSQPAPARSDQAAAIGES
jgi:biopolymer transport protein ExbB